MKKISYILTLILVSLLGDLVAQQHFELESNTGKFKVANISEGITICGLEPTKAYRVQILKDRYKDKNSYRFLRTNLTDSLLVASTDCHRFSLETINEFDAKSFKKNDVYINVAQPSTKAASRMPMSIASQQDGLALVQQFVGDVCGDIVEESIRVSGWLGTFTGADNILGFDDGIVMGTNDIQYSAGSNNNSGIDRTQNPLPTREDDLQALVGGSLWENRQGVFDVTTIEFDFVPTSSRITFEYVFASKEYCEFVNEFNDAFGFFLSGPGIAGNFTNAAQNIALVPNSNDFVSINNINHLKNTEFYINNIPNSNTHSEEFGDCGAYILNNPAVNDRNFRMDGYTIPLVAEAEVIPCETYHIKLVIGDAFDDGFDSAVYLRSKSFRSTGDVYVEFDFPNSDSILYEGCDQEGIIRFVRTDDGQEDLIVDVQKLGTALENQDVEFSFQDEVVIPPGGVLEEFVYIIEDNEDEERESVIIDIGVACNCDRPFYEFYIEDVKPITVSLNDTVHCQNEGDLLLIPTITGGLPAVNSSIDYIYEWSDGVTTASHGFQPGFNDVLQLNVSDGCKSSNETVSVQVREEITGTLVGPPPTSCSDSINTSLSIVFTGEKPYYFQYSVDGVLSELIATTENNYELPIDKIGNYKLENVANDYCVGSVSGELNIEFIPIQVNTEVIKVTCHDATDASILINNPNDVEYTYLWNTGAITANLENIGAGDYSVTISSPTCNISRSFTIETPPALSLNTSILSIPDCVNFQNGSIELTITGGVEPYNTLWSPMFGDRTRLLVDNLSTGIYTARVTDDNGCIRDIDTELVPADGMPTINIVSGRPISCVDFNSNLDASLSTQGDSITFNWQTQDGNFETGENTLQPTVDVPAVYQLILTNTNNNCTNAGFAEIADGRVFPAILPIEDKEFFCRFSDISFTPTVSNLSDINPSYNWSTTDGNIVNGRNSSTVGVNQPGTYRFSVTNTISGCETSANALVNYNLALPSVDAGIDSVLNCYEDEIWIGSESNGNQDGTTIQWYRNSSPLPSFDSTHILVNTPNFYSVRVTENVSGCFSEDEVFIDEDKAIPLISAGVNDTFSCTKNLIPLVGQNLSSSRNIVFEWFSNNGVITGSTNTLVSEANSPGDFQLTALDVDNGCSTTDLMRVIPDPNLPFIQFSESGILTCSNPEQMLNFSTDIGNAMTLEFPNGTIQNFNTSSSNIAAVDSGIYILEVQRSSDNCINRSSVYLDLDKEIPSDSLLPFEELFCNQQNETLRLANSTNQDFTFNWETTNGNIVGSNRQPSVSVEGAGNYGVTITRKRNGCTLRIDTMVVDYLNVPTSFDASILQPVCPGEGGSIAFQSVDGGEAPYRFKIFTNAEYQIQRNYFDLSAGNYQLHITDANGCELMQNEIINAPREIDFSATEQEIIELGDEYTVSLNTNVPVSEIDTIIWFPNLIEPSCDNCLNPTFIPTVSTNHRIELVDTFGCRALATLPIFVDTNVDIFIPNVFSPLATNEVNTSAQIFAKSEAINNIKRFALYDRWGGLVYESKNFSPGDNGRNQWAGVFKNNSLNNSVFVYVAEVEFIDGVVKVFTGDITLLN